MPSNRTLPLDRNHCGFLSDPEDMSGALLEEVAEQVRQGIITRTDELRRWMQETFTNGAHVRVDHGLVDRIKNLLRPVGKKPRTLSDVLGKIREREAHPVPVVAEEQGRSATEYESEFA